MTKWILRLLPIMILIPLASVSSAAIQYDEEVIRRINALIMKNGKKMVLGQICNERSNDFSIVVKSTIYKANVNSSLKGIDDQYINAYSIYYDMDRLGIPIEELERRVSNAESVQNAKKRRLDSAKEEITAAVAADGNIVGFCGQRCEAIQMKNSSCVWACQQCYERCMTAADESLPFLEDPGRWMGECIGSCVSAVIQPSGKTAGKTRNDMPARGTADKKRESIEAEREYQLQMERIRAANEADYEARQIPKRFGSVKIDKTVPLGGWAKIRLTYENDTRHTFNRYVTIRCQALKNGKMVGADAWSLWASDLGAIAPGLRVPKEVAVFHDSNHRVDEYKCGVIEGE